ncbi:hypothetical protein [Caenimonas koreensis]|uniref:hypothetical protein n=1 Tax=Caenimonas koreensis TaxID=367474 RepID=UPI0037852FA5
MALLVGQLRDHCQHGLFAKLTANNRASQHIHNKAASGDDAGVCLPAGNQQLVCAIHRVRIDLSHTRWTALLHGHDQTGQQGAVGRRVKAL